MDWTPARVHALRAALRLTQEEFAERLRAAPRTVRNWEQGRHPPGLALQRALDDALTGASTDEQERFSVTLAVGGGAAPKELEHQTDRRDALQAIGALLGASYVESLELARRTEASDLGPVTLSQLDEAVEQLGLDYLHTPPNELFEKAHAWRQYVTDLLQGRHTLSERRRLYAVAGWLSALLGHLSYDLGHSAAAETHCSVALQLAGEVGPAGLAGWVRGSQALFATFANRPDRAVDFAEAGHRLAPQGSAVAVRLLAQEGRARALGGDRRGAISAIGRAEDAFGKMLNPPSHSIYSFSAPYLPFYAGTSLLWLGQARRAQASAEQAIVLCDAAPQDWPVARVLARFDLASALVQQGELERACAVSAYALDLARQRLTEPVRRQTLILRAALEPYAALTAVRDLDERFRALEARGTAPSETAASGG